MWDDSKLSSYINNMLVPMATALKAHKERFIENVGGVNLVQING